MNPFLTDFYALGNWIQARLSDRIPNARILPAWDLEWARQQVQLAPVVFCLYGNHAPGGAGHGDETVRQTWLTVAVTKYTVQPTPDKGQTVLADSGALPAQVIASLRRWSPAPAYCNALEFVSGPAPMFVNGFLFTSVAWAAQINFIDD